MIELTLLEFWRLVLFIAGGIAGATAAISVKHLSDPSENSDFSKYDYYYYLLAVSVSVGAWLLGPQIGISPFEVFTVNTGITTPMGVLKNVITWKGQKSNST